MRPIWRRTDVDIAKDYVLLLIEGDSGDREFEIRNFPEKDTQVIGGRCVHITEILPKDLVLSGDIFGIAAAVKLADGGGFGFDSNGRWYTDAEYANFVRKHQG